MATVSSPALSHVRSELPQKAPIAARAETQALLGVPWDSRFKEGENLLHNSSSGKGVQKRETLGTEGSTGGTPGTEQKLPVA